MNDTSHATDRHKSSPAIFDPFNSRLARDIRNTLSEAFVDAVVKSDKSDYQDVAQKWLAGNFDAVYADYIKDRLERYARAFERIISNRIDDAEIQALVLWNQGLFFEVHVHLERLWQRNSGDKRQALKGLIQAAGVYVHLQFNRRPAAGRLAVKAVERIQKFADCLSFIENLDTLIRSLQNLDFAPPHLQRRP
jgi:predicted metal-dependent hydrolase